MVNELEVQEAYKNFVEASFYVRPETYDRQIVSEIWGDYPFYLPSDEFEIRPKWKVIDIGAHIGTFSVYAGKKGAKVWAYEPFRENFDLLRKNNQLNGLKIKCFQKAVRGTDMGVNMEKQIKFITYDHNNKNTGSGYIGEKIKEKEDRTERLVDVEYFKDILFEIKDIDFLKLDCEGSEYDILYSIRKDNLVKIKRIVMETHSGYVKGIKLARYLEDNGYKVNWVKGILGLGRCWAIR